MTNGAFGIGLYRDAAFQQLVRRARRVTDRTQRTELYFEAQKALLADVAMVPIATYIGTTAVRKEVRGFRLGPQGAYVLDDVYIVDDSSSETR